MKQEATIVGTVEVEESELFGNPDMDADEIETELTEYFEKVDIPQVTADFDVEVEEVEE